MVRKLTVVIAGLFCLANAFGMDSPSCSELNRLWTNKFYSDFNIRWEAGEFNCPGAAAKVAKAFYDVYMPGMKTDYYTWAKRCVSSVTYDMDCKYYAFNSGGKITLCKKFFSSDDEARAGTIVHEAAHSRGGDPGHVKCNHGKNTKSDQGCDQKLYEDHEGSGYNFEFMYYTRLLKYGKYNYLSNAVLKSWVKYEVMNNFNEVTTEQVERWTGE